MKIKPRSFHVIHAFEKLANAYETVRHALLAEGDVEAAKLIGADFEDILALYDLATCESCDLIRSFDDLEEGICHACRTEADKAANCERKSYEHYFKRN